MLVSIRDLVLDFMIPSDIFQDLGRSDQLGSARISACISAFTKSRWIREQFLEILGGVHEQIHFFRRSEVVW